MLFVDLDDFKLVNDTLGHSGGDVVLCACADRMSQALRETDFLGRLGASDGIGDLLVRHGGDEFVVVLTNLKEPARMGAEAVAERLLEVLDAPFVVGAQEFQVGARSASRCSVVTRSTRQRC